MNVEKPIKLAKRRFANRVSAALLGAAFAICNPGAVLADNQQYNIPAGSLATALNKLAETGGLQLIYDTAIAKGMQSKGLSGNYSQESALQQLLNNSGLSYRMKDNNTVVIEKLPPSTKQEPTTLSKVKVVGTKEYNATDPYNPDYSHPNAGTANKIDTPIMETPFSVQVVPQQILKDQQAISLQDATKNISGVQTNFGYGNLYQSFAIRGFETNNILRNGQKSDGGLGRQMVEMADVDSVEVLKGPAAMLYGRLDPGGMVNIITKKPLDTEYYSLQQQFGSYNMYRTVLDATGPLDQGKTLLYRFDYSHFDSNSFQNNAPHGNSDFVAPSLTWRPNDKFEANVNFEYRNANPLIGGGIPVLGNRPANLPINNYLIGAGPYDHDTVNREVGQFKWSYKFNDNWKINNGLTATGDAINFSSYNADLPYDNNGNQLNNFLSPNLLIGPFHDQRRSKTFNSFLDLSGKFDTYGVQHKILFGTDHYLTDFSDVGFVNGFSPVASQNVNNPSQVTWLGPYTSFSQVAQQTPDWTSVGTAQWNGLYLNDQMKIMEKIHLLLGGRYDWASANGGQNVTEYDTGACVSLNCFNRTTTKDQKFSPRVGLVYEATPWLSAYGNYVQALGNAGQFGPVSLDPNGVPLHAQRSESYEGGLKVQAFDKRLLSTLAFFNIDKSNMAVQAENTANYSIMTNGGTARSRGIEFDVSGAVTQNLNLIGSYAYTDARFTNNVAGLQGNTLANVPKNSGSVWAKYQLFSEHLSMGLGGNFRGARQGDNQNTFVMPGYATMDTFIAYNFKVLGRSKLTTQLNVNNILDKHYFINSNVYDAVPTLGVMPGQPLTVMGSVRLEY